MRTSGGGLWAAAAPEQHAPIKTAAAARAKRLRDGFWDTEIRIA
jgi:hypothetical protein